MQQDVYTLFFINNLMRFIQFHYKFQWGMVVHTFNGTTQETEADGLWDWGQSGLHSNL